MCLNHSLFKTRLQMHRSPMDTLLSSPILGVNEHVYLHNKRRYFYLYVCLPVCLLPMAGRTAGPIKTKLGIGTHVDPGSVLGKVIWRQLANANKTPYRGPQGPRQLRPEDGYLQLVPHKSGNKDRRNISLTIITVCLLNMTLTLYFNC